MKKIFHCPNKGFGVIEILIGISLSAVILTAFLSLLVQTMRISQANIKNLKASLYLRELIELAKDLEQSDWDYLSLSCSSRCYPVINESNEIIFLQESELEEKLPESREFERYLTLEPVYRDNDFKITESSGGGSEDDYTKKAIAKIYWHDGFGEREAKLEAYLYNYNF